VREDVAQLVILPLPILVVEAETLVFVFDAAAREAEAAEATDAEDEAATSADFRIVKPREGHSSSVTLKPAPLATVGLRRYKNFPPLASTSSSLSDRVHDIVPPFSEFTLAASGGGQRGRSETRSRWCYNPLKKP
jgi:hypothetical protein